MPNVDVPVDRDPLVYVWTELATPLTSAAGAYSSAVYEKSSLSLREFEAARITMARINQCAICIDWRTARDVPGRAADPGEIPESFYEAVGVRRQWDGLSDREQLAAEFAERYATDHLGMDAAFWDRLHAVYDDGELVDLALCVASWLALGRFNQVFDIDGACRVPGPAAVAASPAASLPASGPASGSAAGHGPAPA
jgi:alkylhydroperoxidase family enzyme